MDKESRLLTIEEYPAILSNIKGLISEDIAKELCQDQDTKTIRAVCKFLNDKGLDEVSEELQFWIFNY